MTEQVQKEKTSERSVKNPLRGLLSYKWILKNIPFFLFLSALTVLYIANGHSADRTIRRINTTTNELKDLQYEYKTVKSEAMQKSEEGQIVKESEKWGLKVNKETPVRLKAVHP